MANTRDVLQLGNPAIRIRSEAVKHIRDPSVESLVAAMLATTEATAGLGLAAPQVGEGLRIIVVGSRATRCYPDAAHMPLTPMINPELLWQSDGRERGWEACLSIPGILGHVPRSTHVRVRYASLDGTPVDQELCGLAARVFQHEFDHLEGIVYLDRLESTRDVIGEKELGRFLS